MRLAASFIAICFAACPASADIVFSRGLDANSSGQATAHFGSVDVPLFDLFVDIQNADGSSRCAPGDPCFQPSPLTQPSVTSRAFSSGQFLVSFQALKNGNPI